jgi:hypothetical protein
MNKEELINLIKNIQDKLVPNLDTYEQAIYWFIFRNTILEDKRETIFSTRSAEIGYGIGKQNSKPSQSVRSKKLRSLAEKGAIEIVDKSNLGITVRIKTPIEIKGIMSEEVSMEIDLDELDFYSDKRLQTSILKRENYKCFYTGRKINESNCYLDHVIPQSKGGNNSYKNIVATCYDANSMKNDKDVEEFVRELYKEELISLNEFKELKQKIEKLKIGELKPNLELIKKEICS